MLSHAGSAALIDWLSACLWFSGGPVCCVGITRESCTYGELLELAGFLACAGAQQRHADCSAPHLSSNSRRLSRLDAVLRPSNEVSKCCFETCKIHCKVNPTWKASIPLRALAPTTWKQEQSLRAAQTCHTLWAEKQKMERKETRRER